MKLNKWQLVFDHKPDFQRLDRGWRIVTIGFIKIHKRPAEGIRLSKRHYDGFLIVFAYWKPLELVK